MAEDVVSTLEASRILNCSPDNVRRLVRAGVLPIEIETSAGKLLARRIVNALAEARRQQRAEASAPEPEAA